MCVAKSLCGSQNAAGHIDLGKGIGRRPTCGGETEEQTQRTEIPHDVIAHSFLLRMFGYEYRQLPSSPQAVQVVILDIAA